MTTTDVPHSLELSNTVGIVDRLASPYSAAFIPRPKPGGGDSKPSTITRHITSTDLSDTVGVFAAMGPNVGSRNTTPIGIEPDPPVQAPTHPAADAVPAVESAVSTSSIAVTAVPDAALERMPLLESPQVVEHKSNALLILFVTGVIIGGFVATATGLLVEPTVPWITLALLSGLAIIGELLQVDLYGPGTVSVSVAITFASALIAGMPGAACASAAIALVHYSRRRPALYQTAFNWGTHVLAGLAPVLIINLVGLPLKVENLLVLALPVSISAYAYYVIDTGLIATVISLAGREASPMATWRERYRWLVNHYLVLCLMGLFLGIAYTAQGPLGMLVFTLPVLMMHYTQRQYVDRTEDSVRELQRLNKELTRANREVVSASLAMQRFNEELLLTLSKIIDARDPWVSSHAAQVADYAVAIAEELGMPDERLEPLRQAGFLHDIGKIGISEQVLHKPDKLTDEEYEYVKTHAALGGEFLEMVSGLRHLAPFVRHHHERWDGKGYPDRLCGEQIELEARILAVCDAAEAMASDRPYRKGMSLGDIIAEVERFAGTQFDPSVAAAFTKVAEREREGLLINSGKEMMRTHADNGYLLLHPQPTNTNPLQKQDSGALPALT